MTRTPQRATIILWCQWIAYLSLVVLGFCASYYSWIVSSSVEVILPGFPGPIVPGAITLLTTQLYLLIFILILLVVSRRFFPKAVPFVTAFAIGILREVLLEGAFSAYIHLYSGYFPEHIRQNMS